MLNDNHKFRLIPPEITPVLDPYFRPAVLANKEFKAKVEALKKPDRVRLAIEQESGSVFHFNLSVFPADHPEASGNFHYLERFLKFVLWSRGGYKIYFAGPQQLGKQLQQYYSQTATGKFDAAIMGNWIYEKPFEVMIVTLQDMMETDDFRAKKIFETIGTYLGYAVAHYADFYEIRNILILGRVTTGRGGSVIIGGAQAVLKREFPQLLEKIAFHIPSEKEKRHGQAIAAASLPLIPKLR